MTPSDLPPRIAARISVDEAGCWIWTGSINEAGYGRTIWPRGSGKHRRAHRLVWELLCGPIPEHMVLDHVCKLRPCVRPSHLEIVTLAENSRRVRSVGLPNRNGLCRNGRHPWIPANIYTDPLGRDNCRSCMKERGKRRSAAGLGRKARPGPGQGSLL